MLYVASRDMHEPVKMDSVMKSAYQISLNQIRKSLFNCL
jgi:hypothetical protein